MLFPTLSFTAFFALVYPLYWGLLGRRRTRHVLILVASYLFYGAWDWRFVFLLMLSTLVNWTLARQLHQCAERWRRPILGVAIALNLTALGLFKYLGFFSETVNGVFRTVGLTARAPLYEVVAPVGISFFSFMAISYVFDVYRRRTEPVGLLDFAVYLAFFPHLVAGPIVRVVEFVPQLADLQPLSRENASRAAWLIGQGLFKKVVISSYVATTIVDPVFGVPSNYGAVEVLVAIYGYAVQIYADFSGYTDMAIGIALLLGIKFPPNFDRPYRATSLQEFWRRWHMTLSRWLRDYLYVALGGNRHGELATYRNLLLTMALGGLWHGAAATFVVWGLLHGGGLALERWLHGLRRSDERRGKDSGGGSAATGDAESTRDLQGVLWAGLGWLLTFHLVCLAWVFFRASTVESAFEILWRAMTAWRVGSAVDPLLVVTIVGAIGLQLLPAGLAARLEDRFARLPLSAQAVAMGIFLGLTVILGPAGVAPFIYYQF
ncbi:MAG: MBOAT family protein [Chloroflexota bacterium]